MAAITANILFGLNINIAKSLFTSSLMTPLGLTITRMIMSLVVFWIAGFFMPREKMTRRDILIIALAGFLGLVISQAFFAIALGLTSPVTMSIIGALGPIIVLLISALLSIESITPKKTIGVILGISGAALVVLQNNNSGASSISVLGIILALLNVISYSVYMIIIRKMAGRFTSITIMKWMYLWSVLILSPFAVSELPRQRLFTSEHSLPAFVMLGYTAFIASVLGGFLIPIALKRIKATTVSMYSNIQPLTASTAAIIIGQDLFSWDKPLALILIIFGVFLVSRRVTVTRRVTLS